MPAIVKVGCPTGITGLGGGRNQVDVTCLDSEEMEFEPGMANPSTVSVPINVDLSKPSHDELWDLFDEGVTLHWIVGLSNGTAPPTVDGSGTVTYPSTRTYLDFYGYLNDFPFDAAINSVYKSNMSIQRSGARGKHVKTP
jgi:hypothetical protein